MAPDLDSCGLNYSHERSILVAVVAAVVAVAVAVAAGAAYHYRHHHLLRRRHRRLLHRLPLHRQGHLDRPELDSCLLVG